MCVWRHELINHFAVCRAITPEHLTHTHTHRHAHTHTHKRTQTHAHTHTASRRLEHHRALYANIHNHTHSLTHIIIIRHTHTHALTHCSHSWCWCVMRPEERGKLPICITLQMDPVCVVHYEEHCVLSHLWASQDICMACTSQCCLVCIDTVLQPFTGTVCSHTG